MLHVGQFLLFSILSANFVGGCFSSGTTNSTQTDAATELSKAGEAEALAMELNDNRVGTQTSGDERRSAADKFVKDYLDAFGYSHSVQAAGTKTAGTEEEEALKEFQKFMGINPSGKVDTMTKSAMLRKRCSNWDKPIPTHEPKLWEKTSLVWAIQSYPVGLNASDVRELVAQAFKAWEIVIAIDFIPATTRTSQNDIDVWFEFTDTDPINRNDRTGFSVGGATEPVKSRVWIKRTERWGTFQRQEAGRLDIFLTIVHEIGHILGLQHSTDQSSVMFPIFQRQTGEELPVINSDDVEKLRNLYDPQNEVVEPQPDVGVATDGEREDCPSALWSMTRTPSGRYALFVDDLVYRFNSDRLLMGGPQKIQSVFPKAPQRISVAISNGNQVALIEERLVFGYKENEKDGSFSLLPDYPKRLHSMVLFFPSSAFPLANGSVILIDGGVFATYSLEANSPSFLNDKSVYFPNLPEGMRSGVLAANSSGGHLYDMFTSDTVSRYDASTSEILDVKPLTKYLRTVQSSAVMGKLLCRGKPYQNAKVKLFDIDFADPDDLMAEGRSDKDGKFALSGSETEISQIDVKVKFNGFILKLTLMFWVNIYTNCNDETKEGLRKFEIRIPYDYVTEGPTPKKTFDVGVLNLDGVFPGETRDFIN
ncbi:Matrix metalloproteinase [Aphelenchoides besseyi]|nr:Matrix metalloproteinase [Aphelenchoides besseyi]